MFLRLALSFLLLLPASVMAAGALELAAGIYGDADDPELSCSQNPHRLSFTRSPPHAIIQWREPISGDGGRFADRVIYDLIQADAGNIVMRMEGEYRRTEAGETVIWILRLTKSPAGYCWGRTDWPIVRCVAQQVRCDDTGPVS